MAVSFASNILLEDGDMSSSFQSDVISLVHKRGFSIHAIHTGNATGSFYIAVSIDNDNWIVLNGSTQAIATAGDVFWNVDAAGYLSARLHWVNSSGTGSTDAKFSTKEAV
jgi:hypothetical protein